MRKIFLIFLTIFLVACSNEEEISKEESVQSQAESPDLKTIRDFLLEKLRGQNLVRNYSTDGANTKIIFENGGYFTGDYFGKKEDDGFDGKLSDTAAIFYHAEEIHSSKFEGVFEISKMIDDYTYEMKLKDFKITSEVGPHDDIFYNVDFALGINPDGKYLLYRPGTMIKDLDQKDERLIEIAKNGEENREKTVGFIIYNQTDKEVFAQNQ